MTLKTMDRMVDVEDVACRDVGKSTTPTWDDEEAIALKARLT